VVTSTVDDWGLVELEEMIKPSRTYCFLGSSGVGKSTLINKLLGKNLINTGEVSLYSGRGKHTTSRRDLYFLDGGGIVMDNPGMREVGLVSMPRRAGGWFADWPVTEAGCKFRDCTHTHEPGCRVREALESGEIEAESYQNYLKISKEAEHLQLTQQERKKRNRRLSKKIREYKRTQNRDF
jgi:ribosome biogenesis GTPase / thiamine phosphate phosphatase